MSFDGSLIDSGGNVGLLLLPAPVSSGCGIAFGFKIGWTSRWDGARLALVPMLARRGDGSLFAWAGGIASLWDGSRLTLVATADDRAEGSLFAMLDVVGSRRAGELFPWAGVIARCAEASVRTGDGLPRTTGFGLPCATGRSLPCGTGFGRADACPSRGTTRDGARTLGLETLRTVVVAALVAREDKTGREGAFAGPRDTVRSEGPAPQAMPQTNMP